ncbi:MAG: biotin transporter BioY [Solirubrobacterales bacterium]|jgi:biotin transport system substrate-specific component|nr:biotin transporter BioY [Solirubrobacterales bacterium]
MVLADVIPGARVRDALLIIGGAALMALLAQISIPLAGTPVPITGQTLGVVLCGAALGANRGVIAMTLYALAGLVLPVYADGHQGWSVISGASGGYIIGFIVATYVIGRLAELGSDRKVLIAFVSFCAGQLIVFGVGVPWLKVSAGLDWGTAIHGGFTVFIVGGLIKAAVAAIAVPSAWHLVRKVDKKA